VRWAESAPPPHSHSRSFRRRPPAAPRPGGTDIQAGIRNQLRLGSHNHLGADAVQRDCSTLRLVGLGIFGTHAIRPIPDPPRLVRLSGDYAAAIKGDGDRHGLVRSGGAYTATVQGSGDRHGLHRLRLIGANAFHPQGNAPCSLQRSQPDEDGCVQPFEDRRVVDCLGPQAIGGNKREHGGRGLPAQSGGRLQFAPVQAAGVPPVRGRRCRC
jgi:hypothetical protein